MQPAVCFFQKSNRHFFYDLAAGQIIIPLIIRIKFADPIRHKPLDGFAVLQCKVLGFAKVIPQFGGAHRVYIGFGFVDAFSGFACHIGIDKSRSILVRVFLCHKVKELALKENIRLAAVQALGATNSFTVGVYNVAEKKYYANTFSGSFEIVSLTGTINTMNGAFYTHLHMSAGNDKGEVFGGHLNRAVVSATCEMVVDVLDGTVDRQYDPVTGLNLFKF